MAIAAITVATIAAIVDGMTTAVVGIMAEATAVVVETGEAGIADCPGGRDEALIVPIGDGHDQCRGRLVYNHERSAW